MKQRIISIALILLTILSYSAFAVGLHSSWSESYIEKAVAYGLFTRQEENWDFTKPMLRGEMVMPLLNAYQKISSQTVANDGVSCYEDAGFMATALYHLGIMNGVGEGKFSPDTPITREQIAKIILTFRAVSEGKELTLPTDFQNPLQDFSEVSDWAKPYVEKAYQEAIVTGYEDGTFRGKKAVTKEEAITLLVRSAEAYLSEDSSSEETLVYEDTLRWNVESFYTAGELVISWNRVVNGTEYLLTVIEQRNSRYEGDIAPNEQVYRYTAEDVHSMYLYPNRTYQITLTAGGQTLSSKFYVPKLQIEDMAELSAFLPASKEEAEPAMVSICVPVWKLKADGTKESSTAELKVHALLAERVELVFSEIYNGKEQFPIKDIGGYSWRGGRSEHNQGTAIDLNANENYCIYKDGTTIGECWAPYENVYSVTPYGDVVNAFEKYGFTWGGDAWSNPKDYMHFSYLGT